MIESEENTKHIDIVKSLIGEKISAISNSQYFFNDERDDEDSGDVEIETDSGLKICLKLQTDGESVGAYKGDLNVPAAFEVEEGKQAAWKKLPLKQTYKVAGSKIIAIDAMYDRHLKFESEVLAGWRIHLSNGNYIVFYNCGDNSRVLFNEEPDDAVEEIVTTWQPV